MKRAGAVMLFIGVAGYILPLMGRQLTILFIFGPASRSVALVVGIIGLILLIASGISDAAYRRSGASRVRWTKLKLECPHCHNTNITSMDKVCPKCRKELPPVEYEMV